MPPSAIQTEIAVLRHPARQQTDSLLAEVNDLVDRREGQSAESFERKLRVIQKQSEELHRILSSFDKRWIDARTVELSVEEYAEEYGVIQNYKKKVYEIQTVVETELERFTPIDDSVSEMKALVAQLAKIQATQMSRETPKLESLESSRLDSNQNLGLILQQLSNAEQVRASNLPKVELKKFSGDCTMFLSWWSEFKIYVHNLKCFTNLQRFKFLRDLLEGDAATCIRAIPVTDENYVKAINYIIQRFGNPERVVSSVFTKLMEMQKVQKRFETRRLKQNLDRFNGYTMTLEMMSVEKTHYATMLYPLLLRTLPDQLIKTFVASLPDQNDVEADEVKDPTVAKMDLPQLFAERLQALTKFISKEVETQEQAEDFTRIQSGKTSYANQDKSPVHQVEGDKPSLREPKPSSSTKADYKTKEKATCIFCKASHYFTQCRDVGKLSIENRLIKIKQAKICTKCLKSGHGDENCTARMRCFSCKGEHHRFLCQAASSISTTLIAAGESLMPTGHVVVKAGTKSVRARFIFDSASERTWMTAQCADELNLKPRNFERAHVHVFSGGKPKLQEFPEVSFSIITREGEDVRFLALVIPTIIEKEIDWVPKWITNKMSSPAQDDSGPKEIGILFDAADMMRLVQGMEHLAEGSAILRTRVGEVAIGNKRSCSNPTTMVATSVSIEDFWRLEHIGITPEEIETPNVQDESLVANFVAKLRKDGHMYSTIINVNPGKISLLSSNRRLAERQLDSLMIALSKNTALKDQYVREMEGFLENSFAEELPRGQTPRFFMPHFPVVNESKASYKVRPVFNASSHMKGQLSLNDCIYDMPNLLPTSVEMLLKFRERRYGLIGDIRKAYMTVGIHEEFRNFLCFLWFADDKLQSPQVFRMTRNCFGVKDAQFNTIMAIREQAKLFSCSKREGSEALIRSLYMDDLVVSADSWEEISRIKQEAQEILEEGGMFMHKWRWTGMSEEAQDLEPSRELIVTPLTSEKVLGVSWNNVDESLSFNPDDLIAFVQKAKPCKRSILGAAARLHDPIGIISPYIMCVKLLLQKIHLRKLSYDQPLPGDLLSEWNTWCRHLAHLREFSIRRWYQSSRDDTIEYHFFADASNEAYAAVGYLKSYGVRLTEPKISLIISKARLTPIKSLNSLTIPKKELVAALCAARLASLVDKTLERKGKRFFWTDSMNVWHWIRGEQSLEKHGIFIKNRLVEILKLSSANEWHHVPGKCNPADLPSRGLLMEKLKNNSLWLQGPEFLKKSEYPEGDLVQSDALATMIVSKDTCHPVEQLIDLARYSSLRRAIRVCATVIRAGRRFKSKVLLSSRRTREPSKGSIPISGDLISLPLDSAELVQAKQHLVREAQWRCFREAMLGEDPAEDQRVGQFAPFKDESGCLRVGGRLQNLHEAWEVRQPLLLTADRFTELVVQEIHEVRTGHLGTDCVLAQLRQNFWLIRARQVVKSILRRCVTCKRFTARPGGADEAPLPDSRTEAGGCFKNIGVDYLGPYDVRDGRVWICLYTCSVVRAIHLEVVENLSAEAFVNSFKRFTATRGVPQRVNSDNGSNFVRSEKALRALWGNVKEDKVQNFFGLREIQWCFNAPRAAWWGGQFERLIRVVKDCIRKTLKLRIIPLFDFMTVVKEVEAIVNARPLTIIPSDLEQEVALTPAHFLAARFPISLPAGTIETRGVKSDELVKAWKAREMMLNDFWSRWRNQYLLYLKSAHQRKRSKAEKLKIDDIVLIQEDNLPRLRWRMGRITKIVTGRDGQERTCIVKTGRETLVRTVQHLYKLLDGGN